MFDKLRWSSVKAETH